MVDQQVHNQALFWLGGCRLSGAGAWDLACFSVALTLLQTGQLGSKVGCMQLQQKWLGIISKKVVVAQESSEMVLELHCLKLPNVSHTSQVLVMFERHSVA